MAQIIDLRNIVAHEYYEIDTKLIWQILTRQLPLLKTQVHAILKQIELLEYQEE